MTAGGAAAAAAASGEDEDEDEGFKNLKIFSSSEVWVDVARSDDGDDDGIFAAWRERALRRRKCGCWVCGGKEREGLEVEGLAQDTGREVARTAKVDIGLLAWFFSTERSRSSVVATDFLSTACSSRVKKKKI